MYNVVTKQRNLYNHNFSESNIIERLQDYNFHEIYSLFAQV
jgi:hypothetical protein